MLDTNVPPLDFYPEVLAFGHWVSGVSVRRTSALTRLPWRLAHRHIPPSGTMMVVPSRVREYSTATMFDRMMRRAI